MMVSCCSDERQVINAGGAHLKYFALSELASSLSGMSSSRMEVGVATFYFILFLFLMVFIGNPRSEISLKGEAEVGSS